MIDSGSGLKHKYYRGDHTKTCPACEQIRQSGLPRNLQQYLLYDDGVRRIVWEDGFVYECCRNRECTLELRHRGICIQ